MRILLVSEFFWPRLAGGEIVFYELAKELVKRGHEVFVVTSRIPGTKEKEVLDGMKIFRVFSSNGFFGRISFQFKLYSYLKEFIKKNRIDLVHNNAYIPTIPSTWAAKREGAKAITSVHLSLGKNWFCVVSPMLAIANWLSEVVAISFGKHDAIHVICKESERRFSKLTRKPVKLIYNFLDENKFKRIKVDVKEIRKKYMLKEPLLVFVGSLTSIKNIIATTKALHKSEEDFTFLIIGKGPERKKLERIARDDKRIELLGEKPHDKTLEIVGSCDALLLPSKAEQFPLTILEALALGREVIATPVGGIPDMREAGFNIHIVDSVDELPAAIKKIKPRKALDKKAFSIYNRNRIMDEYLALYEEVLHG